MGKGKIVVSWQRTKDIFGDFVDLYGDTGWSIRHTGQYGREYRVMYAGNAVQDFCYLRKAKKAVEFNHRTNCTPFTRN